MTSPRRRAGRRLFLALPVAAILFMLAAPAHAAPAPAACGTAPPEAVEAGDAAPAEAYAVAEPDGSESASAEGESWVATEEPVAVDDPGGNSGDPPPPSQCEPPGDPGAEEPVVPPEPGGETAAVPDVPAVGGAPAAAGPARHVLATPSDAEPASEEGSRPLELPRFVARTILSPLLADGLNALLAFVLGAAALAAYATLAAGATRHHVAF